MSDGASFGTVTIVGVGLLGGSIGKALLKAQSAKRVIGVGRSVGKLQLAIDLGAITDASESLESAIAESDIVVLCTPVGQIISDLPLVLHCSGENTVVTDVGSVKQAIVAAANGDSRFVGSHPMAGSEQAGVVPSRPDLFLDATWAITPNHTTDPEAVRTVTSLAQSLGAATMLLTPLQHDQAVGVTSHLPHAISTALMRLASVRSETAPEIQRLTAGSFADATRVAASSAQLWADIFKYNDGPLIEILKSYRNEIDGFLNDLETGDNESLYKRFESGSEAKRSWSEQR